jgi:heptosyltransferase-1
VLLLGGKGDDAAARRIVNLAGATENGRLLNLAGRTTVAEAAGLVAGSDLVVAVDTGLGHMGVAFDRPTVMLFGSTRPYTVTLQDNVDVLYHAMHCAPCRRRPTCNGAYTCMKKLAVGDVLQRCRKLVPDLAEPRP